MTGVRIWLPAIIVFTAVAPASAAMRKCGDFVAAAGEDRGSEIVARQKAMAGWIESASKLGPAYSAWRLAIDKSLSCLKLADGTHRCQALARPCGIAQAPDNLPPGTDPAPPIKPKREQRI
jgi:hypothetical protein